MVAFIKKLLCVSLALLSLYGCKNISEEYPEPPTKDEVVDLYMLYTDMNEEDEEDFLRATYSCHNKPQEYCNQMLTLRKQYKRELEKETGGIISVDIDHVERHNHGKMLNIFLNVCYKNQSTEEVLFPLIHVDNKWYIR